MPVQMAAKLPFVNQYINNRQLTHLKKIELMSLFPSLIYAIARFNLSHSDSSDKRSEAGNSIQPTTLPTPGRSIASVSLRYQWYL
jgi:hypothetical protein